VQSPFRFSTGNTQGLAVIAASLTLGWFLHLVARPVSAESFWFELEGILALVVVAVCSWFLHKSTGSVRRLEEEVRRQSSEIAAYYDTAPVGLCIIDRDLRFVRVNAKLAEVNGIPADAHVGRTVREVLPDLADSVESRLRHVFETGEPVLNIEIHGETAALPGVQRSWLEQWYPIRGEAGVENLNMVVHETTELKRTEERMRRLAAIVESASVAILSESLEGVLTSWNKGAEALFGYTAEEAIGRNVDILLPPEHSRDFAQLLERVARGESIEQFETVRLHKRGTILPVSLSNSPIRDAEGQTVGLSVLAWNIQDRLRAENDLRESEERFHTAFANAPAGMVLTSPEGRFLQVNDVFAGMLGYTAEELSEKTFGDVTYPEDLEGFRRFVRAALAGEVEVGSFERNYLHKDEHVVWTSVRSILIRDQNGAPRHFITHILDISDRKKAEEALRESEARFRSSVESLLDGFGVFSAVRDDSGSIVDFRYDYINDAGCRLNQMSREQQIGRRLLEILPVHRDNGLFDQYVYVVESGEPLIHESLTYADEYGGGQRLERAFDLRAVKLGDGFAVTWRDITERKRVDDEIVSLYQKLNEHAESLQASNSELESFAYSVSHDLRAPLRHMEAFLELLVEHAGSGFDETAHHYARIAIESSQAMTRLIDDLLAFSRLGRTEMRVTIVNVQALVDQVRNDLEHEIGSRSVRWRVEPLPDVAVDATLFKQVLMNLIGNAVKYTRTRAEAVIEIGFREEGDLARFHVRDNGVGFDMKYADKLVGVFQRLHSSQEFEGNGIGLALVDRIIRRHGGRVWGEGSVDRGATFYFSLPKVSVPSLSTSDSSAVVM
jgi:PAS domain S-box-containing protein